MSQPNNPQHEQMSDESMLRTLAAQAQAAWPQERPLIERYELGPAPKVLDLGCGPGELSVRLLDMFAGTELVGVDLDAAHLERARERCRHFGDRARFQVGDALELELPANHFDLAVCRHLLQAVPNPRAVVENMARATRSGGWLHLVAEDYAMIHFHPTRNDIDEFWRVGPMTYAAATGTDLRSGRAMFTAMAQLGLQNARVDYITIDTVRVDREIVSRIFAAWRDGYVDAIARHAKLEPGYVDDCFADMLECIANPSGYVVWQLPVISGMVP